MLLQTDPDADQVERIAPIREHPLGIVCAGTVEDLEEALPVLESVPVRGEALLRQQGGVQPVAVALTDVQRLGHRPEISLQARRERRGDGERRRRLIHRQV